VAIDLKVIRGDRRIEEYTDMVLHKPTFPYKIRARSSGWNS